MSLFLLQGQGLARYFWKMVYISRSRVSLRRQVPVLLLLFCSFSPAFAATVGVNWSDWQEAKSLYDAGKYEQALAAFQAKPIDSAAYYYNLGTLSLKLGRLGPAVGYLEKANRMKPHDPDIQQNLLLGRTELSKIIGANRLDPASTWTEALADHVSMDEVRSALGLLILLILVFWVRGYWKSHSLRKTFLQPAGTVSMIGLLLVFGLYLTERSANSHPAAVALECQVIRSGPGEQFLELNQVEAGSRLRLLGPSEHVARPGQQAETWRQVRFSQQDIGWVRESGLLVL